MHAQIIREGGQWVLIHPHPSRGQTLNGLIYQGRVIGGNEQFRKTLEHGDIFRIGDEHGTLITLTFSDGSSTSLETTPQIHPIPLGAPLITIGRAPDNMIVLAHPLVSAHHARLEQVPGGYRVIDLNSTNHVYVNGQMVQQVRPLTIASLSLASRSTVTMRATAFVLMRSICVKPAITMLCCSIIFRWQFLPASLWLWLVALVLVNLH
jgi:pSer/pThr/pTyr-binding forkhead associated (FHA) protein